MEIQENISLKPYNTFGLDAKARYYTEISSLKQLKELCRYLKEAPQPLLILGGGSNILFTGDFDGLVAKNNLKELDIVYETETHSWLKAGSGEGWHPLVQFALSKGLGGIENLSLIPGTAGAAPMQNIGAYGVELKDIFHSLEAVDLQTGRLEIFMNDECQFGYRDSIFKQGAKGRYFITSITLRLCKQPEINISYGAISQTLEEWEISSPGIADVSRAVCHIRSSKLPDPQKTGNSGSFFKNPEIPLQQYESLKEKYPQMPGYATGRDMIKVPAGWLIEQCGWKGKQIGHTGAHKDQALVLVNYGGASGSEIYALALSIQQSVQDTFGIPLHMEVNII